MLLALYCILTVNVVVAQVPADPSSSPAFANIPESSASKQVTGQATSLLLDLLQPSTSNLQPGLTFPDSINSKPAASWNGGLDLQPWPGLAVAAPNNLLAPSVPAPSQVRSVSYGENVLLQPLTGLSERYEQYGQTVLHSSQPLSYMEQFGQPSPFQENLLNFQSGQQQPPLQQALFPSHPLFRPVPLHPVSQQPPPLPLAPQVSALQSSAPDPLGRMSEDLAAISRPTYGPYPLHYGANYISPNFTPGGHYYGLRSKQFLSPAFGVRHLPFEGVPPPFMDLLPWFTPAETPVANSAPPQPAIALAVPMCSA